MNLILLVDEKNALSENGKQSLFLQEDLVHFKELTMGNAVIMGRKTYENMRKLSGRINFVLTSRNYENEEDLYFVKDIEELKTYLEKLPEEVEAYCIGGAKVADSLMEEIDWATLTRVHVTLENPDRFAPDLSQRPGWQLVRTEPLENDKYEAEIEYWEKTR